MKEGRKPVQELNKTYKEPYISIVIPAYNEEALVVFKTATGTEVAR